MGAGGQQHCPVPMGNCTPKLVRAHTPLVARQLFNLTLLSLLVCIVIIESKRPLSTRGPASLPSRSASMSKVVVSLLLRLVVVLMHLSAFIPTI